jgi:hypothetical protein
MNARYEGKLNPDGNSITGTWSPQMMNRYLIYFASLTRLRIAKH